MDLSFNRLTFVEFLFVVGLVAASGCQQPSAKSDAGVQTRQVVLAVTGMN